MLYGTEELRHYGPAIESAAKLGRQISPGAEKEFSYLEETAKWAPVAQLAWLRAKPYMPYALWGAGAMIAWLVFRGMFSKGCECE